jgi:hypothetical protein
MWRVSNLDYLRSLLSGTISPTDMSAFISLSDYEDFRIEAEAASGDLRRCLDLDLVWHSACLDSSHKKGRETRIEWRRPSALI